ncbi:MAG: hypothetical protein AAF384_12405 [Pseudomonadota bacterium]
MAKSRFEEILTSGSENLLKTLYRSSSNRRPDSSGNRARQIARNLKLKYGQLVCAVGFNSNIRTLPDVTAVLGFSSYDDLARERNRYFTEDVYKRLSVKDMLAIYSHVVNDLELLEVTQHLLDRRLQRLEDRIENTVDSIVIERYKREMKAIYNDGVAQIDFVERRLNRTNNGFRALINEVALIVESRIIPVGDIFFRENILPQEKRRLVARGLIPREIIESRMEEADVPEAERELLEEELKMLDG